MAVSIKSQGISLSVPIFVQRERRARNWAGMLMGAALDPPRREFATLLDGVSFEAHEGDRVAILGRNGAGKSTLLRVLNGVYQPTAGRLEVTGSCQALLNMSLGFNSEATVRENIFLRGTAMRLKAADLRKEVEAILEFAGLYEKSNHRLRTLSSGQRMRLGFAISTAFQHDIILMDEWVGTGDAEFMERAKERMQNRMGGSKIVVLASHSTGLLREICNKGLVLEQGSLLFAGDIMSALTCYHELQAGTRVHAEHAQVYEHEAVGNTYGCVERMWLDGSVLHMIGWQVDTDGGMPEGLAAEVGIIRRQAEQFKRVRRGDVMRHLGLSSDVCGFEASFYFPNFDSLIAGGDPLIVLGGERERPDTPLRIAASVLASLQTMKSSVA